MKKPIIEIPQGTDFVNALELVRQMVKALAEAGRLAEGDAAPNYINSTNNNFYMMDAAIKGGKLRAFIDGNAPATRLDSRCIIAVDDAREYLAGIGFGLVQDADSMQAFHVQWKAQADSKTQAGRYTLEEAAKLIAESDGARNKTMLSMLMKAVESGTLRVYEPGEHIPYAPATVRGFYEEAHWDDLNAWLDTNAPKLTFMFPDPSAAETTRAGVETTGTDTTLSDETGIMMRAALITHLDSLGFKDSENAFRHSGDNGLSKMAKHSNHGYWIVSKAIEWFTIHKRRAPTKRASTPDGFGAKIQKIMGG